MIDFVFGFLIRQISHKSKVGVFFLSAQNLHFYILAFISINGNLIKFRKNQDKYFLKE